jgi:predicted Zn finger-like uncharacterized protein
MILTCPNCATQYVVKDGAIPPQGRQVRCANCKHSWHQDPDAVSDTESAAEEPETLAEATVIEPRSGPEAEERAYEEAMLQDEPVEAAPEQPAPAFEQEQEAAVIPSGEAEEGADLAAEVRARDVSADFDMAETVEAPAAADWREPPVAEAADDEFSPFPATDEAQPRRRSPALIVLILIFLVVALAVGIYFVAPPEWKARLGIGTGTTSQLALVTTHMDRQQLASGNQLLTVSGRVINPTESEQAVPPLHAQIRTHGGQVVYSWVIDPPARTLAPGASASFNSAEVNAPAGGDELTITLGDPKA